MFVGGLVLVATGIGGIAGGTLICASANSIISSYISEASGGSSFAGWIGGMISGAFCGAGAGFAGKLFLDATKTVGLGALNKLMGSAIVAFGFGFFGSGASELVSAKIDNTPINKKDIVMYSAGMGLVTMIGGIGSGMGSALAIPIGATSTALANGLNVVCTVVTETICDLFGGIMGMLV